MDSTVTTVAEENVWGGGNNKPLGASYGKMMIWFFIVSDSLTFAGFLVAYGFARFKFADSWIIADEVFTHVPFFHGSYPMYYVAFMTFVLIISSVTMVLAVDAGHRMDKKKTTWYMFLTVLGGLVFIGSQAWEWATFIKGDYGALETKGGRIIQFQAADTGERLALKDFAKTIPGERVNHERKNGVWYYGDKALPSYSLNEVIEGVKADPNVVVRVEQLTERGEKTVLSREDSVKKLDEAVMVVEGANLIHNEYGNRLFADLFFFITGFHGFHVSMGIMLNIIVFFNVLLGTYEKRGHYEMVEKVGLYWHFVDLVWVFVFTFFYLV